VYCRLVAKDFIIDATLRWVSIDARRCWQRVAKGQNMFHYNLKRLGGAGLIVAGIAGTTLSPAHAANDETVNLTRCERPYGSIAVVEGDNQGWPAYGLSSPRGLITSMAVESGCFTVQDPASGVPASYLMNVVAGDKEEIDKGTEMAKAAVVEGLVRSGAAGQLLGRVPMGGALMGAFGGFGGKKKTIAAGIRMISPQTGMTIVSGQGAVTKTAYSFGGASGLASAVQGSGYGGSKDGRQLGTAFIMAFNSVIAQGSALTRSAPVAAMLSTPATPGAFIAIDTKMLEAPVRTAAVVRSVRAGTALKPTGQRQGLFVEMTDDFGSKGWVSVEDLK